MTIHHITKEIQNDGATLLFTEWWHCLKKIKNCRLANIAGDMRRTVEITGKADSFFSIPAKVRLMGCVVSGYVTNDASGNLVFRHTAY